MTATLTTVGAAKICMALAAVPTPSVSPILQLLEEQQTRPPLIADSPPSLQVSHERGSATIIHIKAGSRELTRPTTSQEKLIGDIREWRLLGANWDGEGAASPSILSIKEAVSFVRMLNDGISIPEPMMLASGHTALYWNEAGVYADIEFLGDGRIAYFIKRNGDKHKGVVTFDSQKMPVVLPLLLAT